jgi:hypothetical protein
MSHIHFSSPFLRNFEHADINVTTGWAVALPAVESPKRRIVTIIQNKDATFALEVALSGTAMEGLIVPPLSNISLDNYNGIVKCRGVSALTAHIAFATA